MEILGNILQDLVNITELSLKWVLWEVAMFVKFGQKAEVGGENEISTQSALYLSREVWPINILIWYSFGMHLHRA